MRRTSGRGHVRLQDGHLNHSHDQHVRLEDVGTGGNSPEERAGTGKEGGEGWPGRSEAGLEGRGWTLGGVTGPERAGLEQMGETGPERGRVGADGAGLGPERAGLEQMGWAGPEGAGLEQMGKGWPREEDGLSGNGWSRADGAGPERGQGLGSRALSNVGPKGRIAGTSHLCTGRCPSSPEGVSTLHQSYGRRRGRWVLATNQSPGAG